MLYIQQSLGPSEEIIHLGEFHWMHDVKAVLNIVFGIIMAVFIVFGGVFAYYKMGKIPSSVSMTEAVQYLPLWMKGFAFVMFLMGLYSFARMMTEKATTEMAITNLRIIYKRGLMTRHVGEISVDRIEGVVVLQSFLGRLLDYGQLAVRGMGVGEVVLPPIRQPIIFRQAIQQAREYVDKNKGERYSDL